MRILRVHNRYQERGGEDVCFEAEVDLLRAYGHEVSTLVVSNDDIPAQRSLLTTAKLAISTVWSTAGQQRVAEAITTHDPDVVHFDNTFPMLSPAVYSICRRMGKPVVQTLHNYRPLCPGAALFRDGKPCESCLGKTFPWPGVVHACYRDSRPESLAVASMIATHRIRGTWTRDVDRYITMTTFERNKYIEGGFPANKISIKPHFVDVKRHRDQPRREGLMVVGRRPAPQGFVTLLNAWQADPVTQLTIVGDGPLTDVVAKAAREHPLLNYVGRKSSDEILEMMAGAQALIAPTEMYETFGRVAIEAFAQATPVIASNAGATGEVVTHGVTGLQFEAGNSRDLQQRIRWAISHPDQLRTMGIKAREEFEQKYTPARNHAMLMNIYEEAMESVQGHRPSLSAAAD